MGLKLPRGGQREGDLPLQPRVFGQVDLAHPARAQQRENLIVPDCVSKHRLLLLGSQHRCCCHIISRCLDESRCSLIISEQRFHLSMKFLIFATGLLKEGRAMAGVALQGGVIELLDLFPSFRLHPAHPGLTPV